MLRKIFQRKPLQEHTAHIAKKFRFLTEQEHAERSQRAEDNLQNDQLPYYVVERLQRETSLNNNLGLPCPNNFSVNEFLLSKKLGLETLGMVMGMAHMRMKQIFLTGFDFPPTSGVAAKTNSIAEDHFTQGFQKAYGRLKQEAKLLGADMVVDVKVKTSHSYLHQDIELYGTAIKLNDDAVNNHIAKSETMYCTNLNISDLFLALRSGFVPQSLHFTVSSVYTHKVNWGNFAYTPLDIKVTETNLEQEAYALAKDNIHQDLQKLANGHFLQLMLKPPVFHHIEKEYETGPEDYKESHLIMHTMCTLMGSSLEAFDRNKVPKITKVMFI